MANIRWDWLEDAKPQSTIEVAVSQLAKILFDELWHWPPAVAWSDPASLKEHRDLFLTGARRPSSAAFEQAIKCARWELAREQEKLDHYHRNAERLSACPDSYDHTASMFIQTFLTEAVFELIERTENRVKRRHAIACIDQLAVLIARAFERN